MVKKSLRGKDEKSCARTKVLATEHRKMRGGVQIPFISTISLAKARRAFDKEILEQMDESEPMSESRFVAQVARARA